ncbi:hypothetical protein C8R43DRAFT_1025098 [Mycena crocata]|nr:hypothetical protein C8R43DRAFT_1025098 [Mycena crocata]
MASSFSDSFNASVSASFSPSFTSFPETAVAGATAAPTTPGRFASTAVVQSVQIEATSVLVPSPAVASGSAASGATSESKGISSGALAGLSLGIGLLIGLVAAILFVFYRRRHNLPTNSINRDGEALLGYQHAEKQPMYSPAPPPAAMPNAKVEAWIQLNRSVSVSTLASSYFPPIDDVDTVTVARTASSRSAYSQASARHSSEDFAEFEGGPVSRPPDLYKINE